jgi:hypothetical protein
MGAFSGKHLTGSDPLLFVSLVLEGSVVVQVEGFALHVSMGVLFFVLRGRTIIREWDSFFIEVVFFDELLN